MYRSEIKRMGGGTRTGRMGVGALGRWVLAPWPLAESGRDGVLTGAGTRVMGAGEWPEVELDALARVACPKAAWTGGQLCRWVVWWVKRYTPCVLSVSSAAVISNYRFLSFTCM